MSIKFHVAVLIAIIVLTLVILTIYNSESKDLCENGGLSTTSSQSPTSTLNQSPSIPHVTTTLQQLCNSATTASGREYNVTNNYLSTADKTPPQTLNPSYETKMTIETTTIRQGDASSNSSRNVTYEPTTETPSLNFIGTVSNDHDAISDTVEQTSEKDNHSDSETDSVSTVRVSNNSTFFSGVTSSIYTFRTNTPTDINDTPVTIREFLSSHSTSKAGAKPTEETYEPYDMLTSKVYSTVEETKAETKRITTLEMVSATSYPTKSSEEIMETNESITFPENTQNKQTTFPVPLTTIQATTETEHQTTRPALIPTSISTLRTNPLIVTIYRKYMWYPNYPTFTCKNPAADQMTKVLIKQTRKSNCNNLKECGDSLRQLMRNKENIEVDLNYNFVIGGDGKVYEGRGWECLTDPMTRFYTMGPDEFVIGVTGNVRSGDIKDLQIDTLRKFLFECSQQGHLGKFTVDFILKPFSQQSKVCYCPFPVVYPDDCKSCLLAR